MCTSCNNSCTVHGPDVFFIYYPFQVLLLQRYQRCVLRCRLLRFLLLCFLLLRFRSPIPVLLCLFLRPLLLCPLLLCFSLLPCLLLPPLLHCGVLCLSLLPLLHCQLLCLLRLLALLGIFMTRSLRCCLEWTSSLTSR